LGAVPDLTPEIRRRLSKPGTVAVYDADLPLLGLERGAGEVGEIGSRRVEVVARMTEGHKGAGLMPGVFASLRTARLLVPSEEEGEQMTYLLARCRDPRASADVARRLGEQYPDMTVLTRAEFSRRTQLYWLTKTKAGLSLLFAALLGTLVGAVITSQTLYGAIMTSLPQYAVLRALGIPRWRLRALVLGQSSWVAVAGIALAMPAVFGLSWAAARVGIDVLLPGWLLVGTTVVTAAMALLSGLMVLPSLHLAEPITLLR
jgi:putative ABC transport system permease protein